MAIAVKKLPQWIILTAAVCVVFFAHGSLDQQDKQIEEARKAAKLPPLRKPWQVLPSPEMAHMAAMGYDRFLADIYWLGMIQYIGEISPDKDRYRQAYEYIDLITSLDPKFENAYWFGCWAVGYWQGDPVLADKLIQRGIQNFPHSWYMKFIAGVNQYIFAHNAKAAAQYYEAAAREPGAPPFVARQAAILASPIPELEKRWRSLYDMYKHAKDPNVKLSAFVECRKTLVQIYKYAPTPMMRESARVQLLRLQDEEKDL